MESITLVVACVEIISSFVLSALLFLLKVPDIAELRKYRIARKLIGAAYSFLGASKVLLLMLAGSPYPKETDFMLISTVCIIPSFQALLFTFSLITLLDAAYVTKKRLWAQLIPLLLLSALTISGVAMNISWLILGLAYIFPAYYVYQLIYYTILFVKKYRKFEFDVNNFFSDNEIRRVRWVRTIFFISLGIGVWALLFTLPLGPLPKIFDLAFILVCMMFYFYLAVRYLNYVHDFHTLGVVVASVPSLEPLEIPAKNDFKQRLDKWVSSKLFVKQGITIKELAEQLYTNRTYLSNYINSTHKVSFSQWLNSLRIEEAQKRIMDNPNISLKDLTLDLGYKEQSTFSKQFFIVTGLTPSEWKKQAFDTVS